MRLVFPVLIAAVFLLASADRLLGQETRNPEGADFQKSLEAYQKGDFAIASEGFHPLAEQGFGPV